MSENPRRKKRRSRLLLPPSRSRGSVRTKRRTRSSPPQYLSPLSAPETYIVETTFPPDDRSTGFERGTSISKEWEQATTDAAIEVAEYVTVRLKELTGGAEATPSDEPRLREFCRQFAERAFRHPLSAQQQEFFIDQQFKASPDLEAAVQRVVLLVLKSPRFLYHNIGSPESTAYDTAARISYVPWDAPPDKDLLQAAAAGQLATREQIEKHTKRMTADPRFTVKLKEFLLQWMKVDQACELVKDAHLFPNFNPAVGSDLRASFDLFLDDVISSQKASYKKLLLADFLYLNGRLAPYYGVDLPPEAGFQKVKPDPGKRAGVLTHPYLMATFADETTTSPIRRGVFVIRSVLGRTLRPPPDAVTPLPVSLHPDLTTRERVLLQTKSESCQACHGLINPLGFPLENFDALGRIRQTESQKPVDTTGHYVTRTGDTIPFAEARQLGEFLANSPEAHTAFVEKLFYYSVQQPIRAYGSTTLTDLQQRFTRQEFNIRLLMEDIALTCALPHQ